MSPRIGRRTSRVSLVCVACATTLILAGGGAWAGGKGGGGGGKGGGGGGLPANPDLLFITKQTKGNVSSTSIELLDTTTLERGVLRTSTAWFQADWSPDGSRIVAWDPAAEELRVITVDGSAADVLVPVPPGTDIDSLDWSAGPTVNGQEMLAYSDFTSKTNVALSLDGSQAVTLAWPPPEEFNPSGEVRWSPAGDEIAVGYWGQSLSAHVVVYTLDETLSVIAERSMTHIPGSPFGSTHNVNRFEWSPDGTWLVFESMDYFDQGGLYAEIWYVDAVQPLACVKVVDRYDVGFFHASDPVFDATGSRLLFKISEGKFGKSGLYWTSATVPHDTIHRIGDGTGMFALRARP